MKAISAQLKAHMQQDATTLAMLVKVVRTDGTVFGFGSASHDITYLGTLYLAATGHTPTNIKNTSALNVDNLEIISILDSSTITESDIFAGLWDYATVDIVTVNYMDLTMGHLWEASGKLGQLKTGRNQFVAEVRGLSQNLQQTIGRVYTPSCTANLGDTKCAVNMASFTVTGAVVRVIDQHTIIDTARTETNSTTQAAITGITNATTAVFTCAGHPFTAGQQVTVSGVSGMTLINGVTAAIAYIDASHFSMAVDTTNYGVYTSGGFATLSADSEYFQGGKLTWTSGLNIGRSMEIKNYHPNYLFLAEAMMKTIQIGDTYSLTAGCDKIVSTCNSRFNNVINFRGFPHVPGQDAMISGR